MVVVEKSKSRRLRGWRKKGGMWVKMIVVGFNLERVDDDDDNDDDDGSGTFKFT